MNDGPRDPEPTHTGSLLRDVAVLVLVGLVLGVTHNAYMQSAGPGRGLPWIRQERKLVKLGDVAPSGPAAAAHDPAAANPGPSATTAHDPAVRPANPGPPPAETPSQAGAPGTRAGGPSGAANPAPNPGPAPGASTGEPADPAASPASPQSPPALPEAPAIPESREPIEATLDVVRRLYEAKAAVFVDARTAGEYAEEHIAGAILLSFDDVFRDPSMLERFEDRGLPVVTYCGGGDCDVSRNLAFSIVDAGRKRVLVYLGGLPEWKQAGLPVRTGAQP